MVTTLLNRPTARDAGYEMAQYIAKRVQPAGGAVVAVSVGVVPAGAIITNVYSKVVTTLAGGSPVLTIGSNATAYNNLVATMAIAAGSEDLMPLATIAQPLAVDTEFFANLAGGATAGDAYVAIQFIKPLA
jgi:hypothetical protein